MDRWKGSSRAFFLVFLFCAVRAPISGYDVILPDEEAATSLVSASLSDADVELFLSGSWKSSIGLSGSWGTSPGSEGLVSAAFPDLTQGFLFTQSPDITVSLLMMNRFLFEASFIEGYELNTFLLAYQGAEDELLKSVRIGNTGTGISPLPYLTVPDPAPDSLGVAFELGSDRFELEGMLRYDSSYEQTKLYRGHYEVTESRIPLGSYIRGTYFALPGGDFSSLLILVEQKGGNIEIDGRSYAEADSSGYAISYASGTIAFDEAQTVRVLATWDDIPWDEETGIKGTSYADFRVDSGGTAYMILYDPGRNSPCERCGFYQLSMDADSTDRFDAWLVPRGETEGERLSYALDAENDVLAVQGVPADDEFDAISAFPLISRYPGLYGEFADLRESSYDTEILAETLEEVEAYELPSDIIAGSLIVYRNGRVTSDYSMVEGAIVFADEVGDSERIELTYRTTSSRDRGGDILSAVGGSIALGTAGDTLSTGIGFRWNMGGGYAETAAENPGSLLASAEISGSHGSFSYHIGGGFSLSTPNTTGKLRLFGMEGNRLAVSCSDDTVFPASVPRTIPGCTVENRGILYYKDYRFSTAIGGTVAMSYAWEIPEDQIYPYETGSRPGPYTAAAAEGDPFTTPVIALDYLLGPGEWVGGIIAVSKNQVPPDLSGYTSLSFSWKLESGAGELLEWYVEVGSTGEDLDGDGVLDAESSLHSRGYSFDHGDTVLLVGGGPELTGNGYVDTEDMDGNGVLDVESENALLSLTADTSSGLARPTSEFVTQTIPLTREMRSRIRRGAAIRIVVVNRGAEERAGRLLAGNIAFCGGSFGEEVSGSGSVSVSEQEEDDGVESVFPEIGTVFHPEGEEQRVLKVSWGEPDSLTGSATITGYTETVGTGEYGSLVWYMKVVESETSPSLSIAYTDAEGNGIRCDFTAEAGDWRKYSLPLSGGALSINGEETGFTSLDGSEDTFSKFTFTVSGSSSGTILLDEIHLADPKIGVSGAFRAGISYAKAGPILQVGAVAVLSDFSLTQEFLGSGARFAAGFIDSTRSIISSVTETSFSLFTLGIEAALYWDFTDSESLWGGSHTLTLPLGWVRITDSFLYRDLVDELLYEREDSVSITLPKALSWMLSSSSALINGTLKQIWKTSVDSTFPGPVTLAVDAELRQLSADFSLLQTGYFPAWINGFQQILPYKQDLLPKRYGEFSLSASVDTEPVGFSLEPEFGYSIIGSEQRIFTTYGEVSLSLPLAFSRADSTEWGFSLDYSRNFSLRDETEGIGEMTDFVSDLRYMASSVAGFAPLYRSIPISEFFMESTSLSFTEQTDSCSEASYTPAVSLNFTMSEGSSWLNLFIPNIFRISLERELLRKGDTISDSSVWDLSIRSSVRNLFGRLGRYPLLPFYKTEEIIISGLFESKALSPFSVPAEFLFVLQQYLTFLGNKRNSLSIDNRLEVADEKGVEISTKDKLSLTYSWYADGIPLPRDIMERYDPSLMHEEIVMVRIEDIMEAENGFSIAFLPKHRTTLNLVDLGEISAYLGIGLRWEESGDEGFPYAFIAAVYGGLEAELEF